MTAPATFVPAVRTPAPEASEEGRHRDRVVPSPCQAERVAL